MAELLPCPFCGSAPTIDNYGSGACVRIYCKGAACAVYPSVQRYANGDAFEKAAAAWNTRTPPQSTRADVPVREANDGKA